MAGSSQMVRQFQPVTVVDDPTATQINELQRRLRDVIDGYNSLLPTMVPRGVVVFADISAAVVAGCFDATGLGSSEWSGWAIANGNNGTRSLNSKFVRCNTTVAGTTGGSDSSAHTHSLNNHTHASGSGLYALITYCGGVIFDFFQKSIAGFVPNYTFNASSAGSSTTTRGVAVDVQGVTAGPSTNITGSASATDNRPAYVELLPVMRIG